MARSKTTRQKILTQAMEIEAHLNVAVRRFRIIDELAAGQSAWIQEQLPLLVEATANLQENWKLAKEEFEAHESIRTENFITKSLEKVDSLVLVLDGIRQQLEGRKPQILSVQYKIAKQQFEVLYDLYLSFHKGL